MSLHSGAFTARAVCSLLVVDVAITEATKGSRQETRTAQERYTTAIATSCIVNVSKARRCCNVFSYVHKPFLCLKSLCVLSLPICVSVLSACS